MMHSISNQLELPNPTHTQHGGFNLYKEWLAFAAIDKETIKI